jgi:hypothetical protein
VLREKSGGAGEWIELSVPEVRRLFQALGEAEDQQAHRLVVEGMLWVVRAGSS